jgi:hypothetical protein
VPLATALCKTFLLVSRPKPTRVAVLIEEEEVHLVGFHYKKL